eukprot:2103363-Prymnesium_polylepis.1
MLVQLEEESNQERAAKALKHQRQLRFVGSDTPVCLPAVGAGHYHLFLSHAWRTGQDAMRVVKQRLREMVVGISVFLDVDDLEHISALESC